MTSNYYIAADKKHKTLERKKARQLKMSRWWKQQIVGGVCYYCRNKFEIKALTMDHKVPISRGGRSVKSNVVVACKECNTQKKYLTPVEIILKSDEFKNSY